jgi:Transposase IS66 family
MLKRQGITLDRSTLSDWVGRTCWWLRPLYDLMVSTVLSAPVLFADDTTLPVLDPGRGRTKHAPAKAGDRGVVVLRGRPADLERRGASGRRLHLQPEP